MKWLRRFIGSGLLLVLLAATSVSAQDIPASYQLNGIQHIYQGWNNCGPATVTMALTYYGGANDQYAAAAWLKPNGEDKNVSPWQVVEYVNSQAGGTTRAVARYGGTQELLRQFVANDFPVMIEEGYDPPEDPQGWMGHYLLISGYDDTRQVFITQDSFLGPNREYTYDHIDEFWRHFNRMFIVLYDAPREAEVMALLGTNADATQNYRNALETARQEAIANPQDPFAWFNMGTNFAGLGQWNEAATAFDQSRTVGGGLPWRMLWYQFGPYEAYYHVGRYQDMMALATPNFDNGGEFVEETFYYAGLARASLGDTERALNNLNSATWFNPNFHPAQEALTALNAA